MWCNFTATAEVVGATAEVVGTPAKASIRFISFSSKNGENAARKHQEQNVGELRAELKAVPSCQLRGFASSQCSSTRMLQGDAFSSFANTPIEQWDSEQWTLFFAILSVIAAASLCCCCICIFSCICGSSGTGTRRCGICEDILLLFCCYELCCNNGDCCDVNDNYVGY